MGGEKKEFLSQEGYQNLLKEIADLKEQLAEISAGRNEAFDAGSGDGWDSPEFEEIERQERRIAWLIDSKYQKINNSEIIKDRDESMISVDEISDPKLIGHESLTDEEKELIHCKQVDIIKTNIGDSIAIKDNQADAYELMLYRMAYLVCSSNNTIKPDKLVLLVDKKCDIDDVNKDIEKFITDSINVYNVDTFLSTYLKEKVSISPRKTDSIFDVFSFEECMNIIKQFIDDYYNNYMLDDDIKYDGEVIFNRQEVKAALFRLNNKVPNYDAAKDFFVLRFKKYYDNIEEKITKKYVEVYRNLPMGDSNRAEAVKKKYEISKLLATDGVKVIKNYFKKIYKSNTKILELFISNIDKYIGHSSTKIDEYKAETIKLLNKHNIPKDLVFVSLCINCLMNGNFEDSKRHLFICDIQCNDNKTLSALCMIFKNAGVSSFFSDADYDLSQLTNETIYDLTAVDNEKRYIKTDK